MGKQHSECALCGKTIVDLQEQESSILKEVIGGTSAPKKFCRVLLCVCYNMQENDLDLERVSGSYKPK